MRPLVPVTLVLLLAGCGSSPPPMAGPRMPDQQMMGGMPPMMGDGLAGGPMAGMPEGMPAGMFGGGPFDPQLSGPLQTTSLMGDMPTIEEMLNKPTTLMAPAEALGETPAEDAAGPDGKDEGEKDKGEPAPDDGKTSAHGLMISSRLRVDPEAVRVQAEGVEDGKGPMTLTMVVPMQGAVKLKQLKSDEEKAWQTEGAATARMLFEPVSDDGKVAKPTGASAIAMQSAEAPPFTITKLTIEAGDHPAWTITDPQAIVPYAEMPNITPGTKVTVTVTLSGKTDDALPFLVTSSDDDGKIMHLQPITGEGGATTFSRTFTAHQAARAFGSVKLKANVGFIGIKVIDQAGFKDDALRATTWMVKFPSDEEGPATGYQGLQISDELKGHVAKVLRTIEAAEAKHPTVSGEARSADKPE